jgi:hypothetical protein
MHFPNDYLSLDLTSIQCSCPTLCTNSNLVFGKGLSPIYYEFCMHLVEILWHGLMLGEFCDLMHPKTNILKISLCADIWEGHYSKVQSECVKSC